MEVFTHRITDFPGGDKSFIEVPFDVGSDIERIEVSYVFPTGAEGSVIDIGLAHEGRIRGWTGAEYGHIFVAEDHAAPGYKAGPLDGRWHVVLGIVRVGPQCWVDLSIRLVPRRARWLAGELHSHTEHSDGGVLAGEAVHRARMSGCDFVALTDHNTTAQNRVKPDNPGILVIDAMELTSYWGHTNFLGLADPVDDWRCYTPEDVPMKMAEAREKGATIVVNHPFQASAGGRWQCGIDVPLHALEIWNGNWAQHNVEAVAFWQEQLAAGKRLACTGGSDFHLKNRRRHGRPANRLHVATRSVAGILEAVRAGANVVTSAPDETMVFPLDNTPMFGASGRSGQAVGLGFEGLARGDEIRLISRAGVIRIIEAESEIQVVEAPLDGGFLRTEVWRGDVPCLFSNPIYVD
ncbi:CehA/McbA family metallohydrolase [Martelella mangrovi]|uniref:Polymerase/histidinol phosphatase N-terminal domain-containing protein n=1 Tax=Martelella mangrovi TaxID=1397477 RepID=A0ABV2I7U7_9HYPH